MDLPTAMGLQVKSGSIKLTELFSSLNYGESEWYRILLLLLLLNLNIKIHI